MNKRKQLKQNNINNINKKQNQKFKNLYAFAHWDAEFELLNIWI